MQIPYRHTEKIKINQTPGSATRRQFDAARCILLLLPERPGKTAWQAVPYGELLKSRLARARRADRDCKRVAVDLPNANATHVVLQLVKPDSPAFELLTTARKLAGSLKALNPPAVLVQLAGLKPAPARSIAEAVCSALLAAACPMPSYKSDNPPAAALGRVAIHGVQDPFDSMRLQAETVGNHLTRWLAALPGNELTPGIYLDLVKKLAKTEGWNLQFIDRKALARKQAGAFLAVCQASPVKDAGIVRLRYTPKRRGGKKLALVGKGICFDTGGVNVKPAKYMNGMHEDMQGSAVALGTLLALSRLEVDFPVECWLALAENHIGSRAYKPNDVVTASNGVTIEIRHTDAEGRMVLADTLVLASRAKPAALIDYATLTGACMYALSTRYSGVFTNRDYLAATLIETGRSSGERVWPFPLDADYDSALESGIADTLQCSLEGEADHIQAARFLQRFVDRKIDWVHVDLAASNHKGGLAHIPTDTTGFGVRFSLNLLLDQGMLEQSWN